MTCKGIRTEWIDPAVDRNIDFHAWATGGWANTTEIPSTEPVWGVIYQMARGVRERVRGLIEELSTQENLPGSDAQKVGDFFAAAMDEAAIERLGLRALDEQLAWISNAGLAHLPITLACLHEIGVPAFFGLGSLPDFNDSTRNACVVGQSGLGLGERDYYLTDEGKNPEIRQMYVAHIARMFELSGKDAETAVRDAQAVMELETAMAGIFMPREEARDPSKVNNPMSRYEFFGLMSFDLQQYMLELGVPFFDNLIVEQPDYFRGLNEILNSAMPFWKIQAYLRWQLLHKFAPFLSSAFATENFEFFGRTINGQKEPRPRWERMVTATDSALGEALSKVYVARYFPPQAKEKMNEVAANILSAMREALESAAWMGDETRQAALAKLDRFEIRVGYPDKWIDYSSLEITRDSLIANYLQAARFNNRRDLLKIGTPVDRNEWHMLAHTVNAYLNPFTNQLTFTAGILQPPFFDMEADDALIYGSIGSVIAHEGTHPFDKHGSQFDADGNIRMWFTPEDLEGFNGETAKLIRQYNAFSIPTGKHVRGADVVGEAAADLGGVRIAFRAFSKLLDKKGRRVDADGFSDEQRFFVGFAQVWAEKRTLENLDMLVSTNEHPPGMFRVNGTLANMAEFQEAFDVPDGSPMILPPANRCQIWSMAKEPVGQH